MHLGRTEGCIGKGISRTLKYMDNGSLGILGSRDFRRGNIRVHIASILGRYRFQGARNGESNI